MNVLFYIDTIGYGGAERVIANLANQLLTLGYSTTVVTTFRVKTEYTLDEKVLRYSMDEEYKAPFWKRNFKLFRRLRGILKKERPDVAIAFLPESIFRLALASLGLKIKKIYSVRSDPRFVYKTRTYKMLAKVLLPTGDGFVFQTEDAKNYFPENIKRKSTIIFNQVSEDFYKVNYRGKREGIVATGRLVPPKDHFYLIDAFKIIEDKIPDNLTIFGDGPLRESLTNYIISKGLQKRVLLPGSVSNVAGAIAPAKLYVLSSNHEGMPNGLMEAMAAGVPCVSTDCPCGGPKTLFGERAKALLVPISNPKALAESMLKVLTSDELMALLSDENKNRAKLFTPGVVVKEWDSFIRKTAKKEVSQKLIIYIGTLQSGGAERVVSEISAMYANHFKEVVILTYYDAPVFYHIDSRVRIDCVERITGTTNKFSNACWLRRYVRRQNPDVLLSFLMPFNMMAIASLAFTKTKVVVCERQDPSDVKTWLLRKVRNFLYHFCSRIEVQTQKGKNYFSKSIQKKIVVIPNPNHITPEERKRTLASHKENRVTIVGRLIPLKNHRMLINAFSKTLKSHPEYRLDIYGEGEMQDAILAQINELGLGDSVFLCGRTDNVPSALVSSRIFVLCSNVEGMPNALMEAVALGIPSIATDVSGVRDIINDGKNGFIIPVGDEEALVKRLLQLMDSEELQGNFAEASAVVLEKFDKKKIFKQWLELVSF